MVSTLNARTTLWTLPNVISMYRIAALPAIVVAIWGVHRSWFAGLIVANLVSDIVDGVLARALKQQTDLGAKLDSVGDLGTYVLALAGLLVFEREFIASHLIECALLVGFFVTAELVSLARFHRLVSMHLYSSKAAGYAQGFFFATLFLFGYLPVIFYPVLAICLFNNLEEIAILFMLKESRSNARGLYWVAKSLNPKG